MAGSILSQAEIQALLYTGDEQSAHEKLVELLSLVTRQMVSKLSDQTTMQVQIDGPYVERLTAGLGQVITDDCYIMAADLGTQGLYLFLSVSDANVLGAQLDVTPDQATWQLGSSWIKRLAGLLVTQATIYPVRSVVADSLVRMPQVDQGVIVRHLIRFGDKGMELCILLQDEFGYEMVAKGPSTKQPLSRQRLLKGGKSPVSAASFSPIELPVPPPSSHTMTLVEDIDLSVTVELGQVELTLNEVLELKPQSVIPLERHVGESVDIYINNRQSAKGEVMVLDEHFGVRILEIIPKSQRLSGD